MSGKNVKSLLSASTNQLLHRSSTNGHFDADKPA